MLYLIIAATLFAAKTEAQTVRLLLLMPDKYGANYFLDRDDFENFGWEVTTAGVNATVTPCPDYAGPLGCPVISVDTLVSEIQDISGFDVLVVSSGSGGNNSCANLISNPATLQMISSAVDSGLIVGAMCSGVRVLAASGVLSGIHVTSNLRDSTYCTSRGAIHDGICGFPVVDGQIVTTSIGDYYHHQNTEAVMTAFCENMKKKKAVSGESGLVAASFIPEWQSGRYDTARIKTYGGPLADGGRSVCYTSDGGLLISGFTFSSGQGYSDAILLKTDADGNLQWSKTVGGLLPDYANSAVETNDRQFLICGYTYSSGAGSADVMVCKTNSSGNILWTKTYGGPGYEIGTSVMESADGKYLVCGRTESYGNGKDDVWLIKLDTAGNLIWQRTYGGVESEAGNGLTETTDGGYVIVGNAGNRTPNPGYGWWGDRDAWLIKTDTAGNPVWDHQYSYSIYQQWGNSVIETEDHHFLIAGSNDITGSELQDVYFIRADSAGGKKLAKSFGEGTFYDYGNAISAVTDHRFLICGTTKSITGGNDLYLLTINGNGALQSKQIIGGDGNDWGNAVTGSGGVITAAGITNSYGNGGYDILLAQVDDPFLHIIDTKRGENPSPVIAECAPNPFNAHVSLKITIPPADDGDLTITNQCGQLVKSFGELAAGDHHLTWNGRDNHDRPVPDGLYFVSIRSKAGMQVKKLVRLK